LGDVSTPERLKWLGNRTSLVLSKLDWLLQSQLVGVHFGVKAIVWFQDDRQVSGTDVDRAPWSHSLLSVGFLLYILDVPFPKALDGATLLSYGQRDT
jgi:hypothetical protein